jgi:threonine dehydratase
MLIPVIRQGLTSAGRYLTFWTTIPDRPGELSKLLSLLATHKANILSVEHHREGVDMPVNDTRVDLTLQLRNHDHIAEIVGALGDARYAVHRER